MALKLLYTSLQNNFIVSYRVKWHTKRPVDRQKILEIRNQSIVESRYFEGKKLLQEISSLDKNDLNMNVEKTPT